MTVAVLDLDEEINAFLLEFCDPGTPLREQPEIEQDEVIAGLLKRLWRPAPEGWFRPLSEMIEYWIDAAEAKTVAGRDEGLLRAGVAQYRTLIAAEDEHVLLTTDLHAGNVLRARRQPWLVIDPKPFVGDPCYDVTQHFLNCLDRLRAAPHDLIGRMADLAGLDVERVQAWLFARLATEAPHLQEIALQIDSG